MTCIHFYLGIPFMKELILTNTNKVIRDAFIEDDAIYFHYKPILR